LIGIIPWEVDVPEERVPYVNYFIVVSVIVVSLGYFAAMGLLGSGVYAYKPVKVKQLTWLLELLNKLVLDGYSLEGLFGHMWLHGGIVHLAGNMLFLWIFGNAVCSKLGNVFYLPIYLLLGIFAAVCHLVFQGGWAMGASGAVNGIVGLYLVLFPQNNITCYFFMLLIYRPYWKEFTLSSYWMILFWLVFDILGMVTGGGNIAYFAHVGGFAAGFGLGIVFLLFKSVMMERYERSLLEVFKGEKIPCRGTLKSERKISSSAFPRSVYIPEVPAAEEEQDGQIEPSSVLGVEEEEVEGPALSVDDFLEARVIRFSCVCGKAVKVKKKYAGRVGKCPRCKRRLEIPGQSSR
jgi:membrane associated rhomboid family serine protease